MASARSCCWSGLGSPGEYTARAQTYAKSFFETAGLRVVEFDDTGEVDQLRNAIVEHRVSLSCLCSTDDNYLTEAQRYSRC